MSETPETTEVNETESESESESEQNKKSRREYQREYHRRWREDDTNRRKEIERHMDWRSRNYDHYIEYQREYQREYYHVKRKKNKT